MEPIMGNVGVCNFCIFCLEKVEQGIVFLYLLNPVSCGPLPCTDCFAAIVNIICMSRSTNILPP